MSNESDTLRAAAAVLLKQADQLDGKPAASGFNVSDWRTWWPAMLAQFAKEGQPHEWRDWGPGVLPDQAGDGTKESPLYESHKPFWEAMTRIGAKDLEGERFVMQNCVKRGGWADFEANVRFLWNSKVGIEWRADPANIPILPKTNP